VRWAHLGKALIGTSSFAIRIPAWTTLQNVLPGVEEMLRINGVATVTTEESLMAHFIHDGKRPRSVVLVETREVYFHCSKAPKRSDLWNPDKRLPKGAFPDLGQIARDQFKLLIPARVIDLALGRDAKKNLY
jgi:uncharacterized protein